MEGLKLAAIQEPITYLLYAGRWFPTTGYMHRPLHGGNAHARAAGAPRVLQRRTGEPRTRVTLAGGKPGDQYDFNWTKPGFPGTIIAGRYVDAAATSARATSRSGSQSATSRPPTTWPRRPTRNSISSPTALALPETSQLNVVEIPDDTLPAVWAPELAGIMGSRTGDKSGIRLLANTIAHQWWGSEVSPRTLNDAWITNGMARYAELMYMEEENGKNAMQSRLAGRGRQRPGLRHHAPFVFWPRAAVLARSSSRRPSTRAPRSSTCCAGKSATRLFSPR